MDANQAVTVEPPKKRRVGIVDGLLEIAARRRRLRAREKPLDVGFDGASGRFALLRRLGGLRLQLLVVALVALAHVLDDRVDERAHRSADEEPHEQLAQPAQHRQPDDARLLVILGWLRRALPTLVAALAPAAERTAAGQIRLRR